MIQKYKCGHCEAVREMNFAIAGVYASMCGMCKAINLVRCSRESVEAVVGESVEVVVTGRVDAAELISQFNHKTAMALGRSEVAELVGESAIQLGPFHFTPDIPSLQEALSDPKMREWMELGVTIFMLTKALRPLDEKDVVWARRSANLVLDQFTVPPGRFEEPTFYPGTSEQKDELKKRERELDEQVRERNDL